MRFALLDTNPLRAEHTHSLMISAGYRGQIFQHVKSFTHAVLRDTFDLAIISSAPVDTALAHALLGIRQHPKAPLSLVMLSRASEQDMIDALNQGADDCVLLPVDLALLLARVAALLRRHPSANASSAAHSQTTFPGYRFDMARSLVETNGKRICLTPKEFALGLMLFRNIGRQLSRQYLIDGVWFMDTGAVPGLHSRSLDTHISRIRHKLHLTPARGYQLSSIYSHGYRLDRTDEDAPAAEHGAVQREDEEVPATTDGPPAPTSAVIERRPGALLVPPENVSSWPGF